MLRFLPKSKVIVRRLRTTNNFHMRVFFNKHMYGCKYTMSELGHAYSFPIWPPESLYFRAKNAYVTRAELRARDITLAIFEPIYESCDAPEPPVVDLNFLGGKPFHAVLAAQWQATIVLYTRDDQVPTLIYGSVPKSLTWVDVGGSVYEEKIIDLNRTFVYTPTIGGFRRA